MQKNHLVVVRCLVHQIIKSVVATNYAFLKMVLVVLPDRSRTARHMMAQTMKKTESVHELLITAILSSLLHSGFTLQWEGPLFYMCMPSPNFFNQSNKLYKNIVKKYLGTPQGLGYPNQGPQGPLGYTWGPKKFFQNFSYRTKIGSYFTHFLHLFCKKIQKSRKP